MQSPAKLAVRDRLLTTRRRRSLAEVGDAAREIAGHLLDRVDVRRAATVAAYVSGSGEPGTGPLLDGLRAAGKAPKEIELIIKPDALTEWDKLAPVYDAGLRAKFEKVNFHAAR